MYNSNNNDFVEDTIEELKKLRKKQRNYNNTRNNGSDETKKCQLQRSSSLPPSSRVKTIANLPKSFCREARAPPPHNPVPPLRSPVPPPRNPVSICTTTFTASSKTDDRTQQCTNVGYFTFHKENEGGYRRNSPHDKNSSSTDDKGNKENADVRYRCQNFSDKNNSLNDNKNDKENVGTKYLPQNLDKISSSTNNKYDKENVGIYQRQNLPDKVSSSADDKENVRRQNPPNINSSYKDHKDDKPLTIFAIMKAEPIKTKPVIQGANKIMHQVDSYVTWINTQLEKRPKSRYIKDLSQDMKDGVAFLQLVEAISNTTQEIVDSQQLTASDMRKNIKSVLEFLSINNVRVHHIPPKEIVEGNVKATMRLVLALAAHFKPDSFQGFHSTPKYTKFSRQIQRAPSVVSLVSDAATSLAEASKNASKGRMSWSSKFRKVQQFEEKTSTPKPAPISYRPRSLRLDNTNATPNLPLSCESKRSARYSVTDFPCHSNEQIQTRSKSELTAANTDVSGVKKALLPSSDAFSDADVSQIVDMQESLLEDLGDTKEVLAKLQNLLLDGYTPEECSGIDSPKDESFQEQLVVKNIMLENIDSQCSDLRNQSNELKEINLRLTSEKTGFELRLSQQEQLILSLKSKLLVFEHPNKPYTNEEEWNTLLVERGKELQLLHQELTKRDEIIENQKVEIESLSHDVINKKRTETNLYAKLESSESMVSNLQVQLRELTDNMHSLSVNATMNSGNHSNSSSHSNSSNDSTSNKLQQAKVMKHKQKIAREHNNMMVTLANIQQRFPSDDPVQHAFQSMQQSMTTLINTLSMLEQQSAEKSSNTGSNSGNVTRDNLKPMLPPKPSSKKKKSASTTVSSDSGYDHNANMSLESSHGESVKIVYFLGKSVTPTLKNTDIGLGYFTLRDFKEVVKRPGRYRYFFKSKDRDFGFVREELLFDDDTVPGHDNKIVCWMERNMAEDV